MNQSELAPNAGKRSQVTMGFGLYLPLAKYKLRNLILLCYLG